MDDDKNERRDEGAVSNGGCVLLTALLLSLPILYFISITGAGRVGLIVIALVIVGVVGAYARRSRG
jgi:hypothetical protein